MASAPHLTSPSSPQGAGEQPRVKGQEVVGPVGRPLGLRHLHLAAVPHASLGMEVMEEVPEGETVHFQACLEDPEWERGRMSHRAQEATRLHIYNSPVPVFLFAPHRQERGVVQSVGFGARQPEFESQLHTISVTSSLRASVY